MAILISIVPVEMLRNKFKKRHRELTETIGYQHMLSSGASIGGSQQNFTHPQGYQFGQPVHTMSAYEMYDKEQQRLQMLQHQQLLQQYQQYPPTPQPQQSSQELSQVPYWHQDNNRHYDPTVQYR